MGRAWDDPVETSATFGTCSLKLDSEEPPPGRSRVRHADDRDPVATRQVKDQGTIELVDAPLAQSGQRTAGEHDGCAHPGSIRRFDETDRGLCQEPVRNRVGRVLSTIQDCVPCPIPGTAILPVGTPPPPC